MSRRRVALATCERLRELPPEEQPLLAALDAAGLDATPAVWSDPDQSWEAFDLVLLRSTWDYHLHVEEFLRWVARVSQVTRLWNPPEVVRWNSHKVYLRELERHGVPIIPTVLGSEISSLERTLQEKGWSTAVLKPEVSAASHRTYRIRAGEAARNEALLSELRSVGEVLLQPYLPRVESEGERSLIFLGGKYSHAVLRQAALAPEATIVEGTPFEPTARELAVGEKVLARAPDRTLYGRVDLALDYVGQPRLMELEVIEPSLFFASHPGSAERFTRLIEKELA